MLKFVYTHIRILHKIGKIFYYLSSLIFLYQYTTDYTIIHCSVHCNVTIQCFNFTINLYIFINMSTYYLQYQLFNLYIQYLYFCYVKLHFLSIMLKSKIKINIIVTVILKDVEAKEEMKASTL